MLTATMDVASNIRASILSDLDVLLCCQVYLLFQWSSVILHCIYNDL
jgi:hypothetical protein